MRPRRKKHYEERMNQCKHLLIEDPASYKGQWSSFFHNNNPIYLEIGCGKGTFVVESALSNPDINYLAMEVVDTVILLALEKAVNAGVKNVQFARCNAKYLLDYFSKGELSRIYINFSDPWPKTYQAKLRLSHKNFLDMYKQILIKDGEIHQKTDNRPLFDFSVRSFTNEGFPLKNVSYDLHNSDFQDNIVTEYEKRFSDLGQPIFRLEAVCPEAGNGD